MVEKGAAPFCDKCSIGTESCLPFGPVAASITSRHAISASSIVTPGNQGGSAIKMPPRCPIAASRKAASSMRPFSWSRRHSASGRVLVRAEKL